MNTQARQSMGKSGIMVKRIQITSTDIMYRMDTTGIAYDSTNIQHSKIKRSNQKKLQPLTFIFDNYATATVSYIRSTSTTYMVWQRASRAFRVRHSRSGKELPEHDRYLWLPTGIILWIWVSHRNIRRQVVCYPSGTLLMLLTTRGLPPKYRVHQGWYHNSRRKIMRSRSIRRGLPRVSILYP